MMDLDDKAREVSSSVLYDIDTSNKDHLNRRKCCRRREDLPSLVACDKHHREREDKKEPG